MSFRRFVTGLAASSAAASTARAGETMPQLDFANPNHLLVSQVVWGAMIFVVFYLLLSRWGLPQVAAVLEMRARTIGDDLEQARLAKASSDQAVAELQAARRQAHAQSAAAIAEATKAAKADAEARAAEQTRRLDGQLAESDSRIAASRADAMGRLREVATETASAVIARVAGRDAEPDRVARAVADVMAQRGLPA